MPNLRQIDLHRRGADPIWSIKFNLSGMSPVCTPLTPTPLPLWKSLFRPRIPR